MKKEILKNELIKISDYIIENELLLKNNASLIGGTTGIAVFYETVSEILPDLKDKFYYFLNATYNNIDTINNNYTYSDGMLGFFFTLNELKNNDLIELDDELVLEFNKAIATLITQANEKKDYELFTGLVGIGLYCLNHKNMNTMIPEILEKINTLSFKDENGIYWKTVSSNVDSKKDEINFGHAHGITSIIVFLIKVLSTNIQNEKVTSILNNSLSWLLSKKKNTGNYSFPCVDNYPCLNTHYNSRLAWCYGDLMIAYAFCLAGIQLKNKNYLKTGIEIAKKVSKIKINESGVEDAMFCHGSSGVLFILYKINKLTPCIEFQDAIDYWLSITLDFSKKGYSFILSDGSKQSLNILEGVAGVGLVLSTLYNDKSNWDKYFLF